MSEKFDFCGYATKNDLKCADGRTIRKNAFVECDGLTVPLVWGHKHDGPGSVLGHALLENRDDGVFTYGTFNETEAGKNAKELVRHGDVKALSIYANQLVQKGGDVLHGMIREVSLCLAGANPGARIEDLSFEHAFDEDSEDFEALLFNGNNIELSHADEDEDDDSDEKEEKDMANNNEKTVQDVFDELTEEQKNVVYYMIGQALDQNGSSDSDEDADEEEIRHADEDDDEDEDDGEKTVQDVFDELTDEQKDVVYYMIGQALEQNGADNEEDEDVKHNAFENDYLAHAEISEALDNVIADAKKFGSLKDSYEYHMQEGALAHAIDTTGMDVPTMTNANYATNVGYGVNGIDYLFPDARTINNIPEFIGRDTEWVTTVMNGVHKTPFSRIKSIYANITEDEARAKGYIKGTPKKNEFFSLMKRVTVPQTVYKKQKMDRDDIVDITDFDVVAWIKGEMRTMLNEELARAILIGDDRLLTDDDKISPEHIRPIVSDADLFTIKRTVTAGATDEATAKNFMKTAIRARKDYKGSGNPTLFTTEDVLTSMLLIEDGIGHYIYKSEAELATALRVSNIVTVPVMEGYKDASGNDLMGIIVNLKDYNVGADKGGEVNMFDDFNIDYNQFIYLIETRCSGALIKPYSAIALTKAASSSTTTTA